MDKSDVKKLIAVLILHGGYALSTKRVARIAFYNRDRVLHELFRELVKIAYNIEPSKYFAERGATRETLFSRGCRPVLEDLLRCTSSSFQTTPGRLGRHTLLRQVQPSIDFLLTSPVNLRVLAFRLAMSTAGYFRIGRKGVRSIQGVLALDCSHPGLVEEWRELATALGVQMHIKRHRNVWSHIHGLETKARNSIIRFHRLGGFVEGVRCYKTRAFAGCTYNALLRTYEAIMTGEISLEPVLRMGKFSDSISAIARLRENEEPQREGQV